MKKTSMVFALMIISLVMLNQASAEEKGSIKVIVKNIANDKGVVKISLNNSEENYTSKTADPFRKATVEIKGKRAEFTFDNLTRGEYAIRAFHDENKNGIMDKNFIGIPSEDYAFSNNATGTFGPASYSKAKFILDKAELVMEIDMTSAE